MISIELRGRGFLLLELLLCLVVVSGYLSGFIILHKKLLEEPKGQQLFLKECEVYRYAPWVSYYFQEDKLPSGQYWIRIGPEPFPFEWQRDEPDQTGGEFWSRIQYDSLTGEWIFLSWEE